MLRNLLATFLGLVVGMAWNGALIELNSSVLFPMPEGMDPGDLEAFQAYLDTLPATAFLVVMAAHLGQAGLGGWVAARLSGSRPVRQALVVGAISMIGGLMMLFLVDGPVWMWVEVPLYLVLAWLAGRAVERSRSPRS